MPSTNKLKKNRIDNGFYLKILEIIKSRDSLLIFTITCFSYFLVYLYEIGYCVENGINIDFININLILFFKIFFFTLMLPFCIGISIVSLIHKLISKYIVINKFKITFVLIILCTFLPFHIADGSPQNIYLIYFLLSYFLLSYFRWPAMFIWGSLLFIDNGNYKISSKILFSFFSLSMAFFIMGYQSASIEKNKSIWII